MEKEKYMSVEQYYIHEVEMITIRTIGIIKLANLFGLKDIVHETFSDYGMFYDSMVLVCLEYGYFDLLNKLRVNYHLVEEVF